MTDSITVGQFADWHPHYTPRWLSERIATHLPRGFSGTVVDPACGAGNLLIASSLRLGAQARGCGDLKLRGVDTSLKAVAACVKSLAELLPRRSYHISRADFLRQKTTTIQGPTAVVMNPPFKGYGRMSVRTRRQISQGLGMKGRFNLSHAFVRHAMTILRPTYLISLLPSNWVHSRAGWFRSELTAIGGSWEWEDVGDAAFDMVDVHVGILVWRSATVGRTRYVTQDSARNGPTPAFEVRCGVATGADSTFLAIAARRPAVGKVITAVRGRDVDRATGAPIWLPAAGHKASYTALRSSISSKLRQVLEERSCVLSGRRGTFEFHESAPDWFTRGPKLLLPEIVSGNLRIELDAQGRKLPLHSVIAVRAPSIRTAKNLRTYLLRPEVTHDMLAGAPRLSGGAKRLQVGAVRDSITRWLQPS